MGRRFWKSLPFVSVPAMLLLIQAIQWWGARPGELKTEQIASTKIAGMKRHTEGNPYTQLGGGSCQVSKLLGFHTLENWGVWSASDPAELVLAKPLSGRIHLKIVIYTMNDRISHELKITVGHETRTINVPTAPGTFDLIYWVSSPAGGIVLSGLKPRSARSAGLAPDDRAVGVGLVRVECNADLGLEP